MFKGLCTSGLIICIAVFIWAVNADAAPPLALPGPADAGRVSAVDRVPAVQQGSEGVEISEPTALAEPPAGAKDIHFILKRVNIEGATAFSADELADIYAQYLSKDVTLDVAWTIAAEITKRYRDKGYFLSRAYVPAQSVKEGVLVIKVIEGYVGSVELKGDQANNYVVREYIGAIKEKKPIKADEVESFLLRLNDLPGLSFRAVLSPDKEQADKGAVLLTLEPSDKSGKGVISFDNYGSRFLGPEEGSLSYSTSILPLQNTNISGLISSQTRELKSGSASHDITILPDLILNFNASYTDANPGYNLEKFDINSQSTALGMALSYQLIRQRDEDFSFKLSFDGRNTNSDTLGAPLTRDRVRAIRFGANFDITDNWQGLDTGSFTLSHGLNILGSNDKGDPFLSRGDADPYFTKLELELSRTQGITDNVVAYFAASGQLSTDPLFSSEQFGYGGQAFGRAYDASEITGDEGVAGSAELRYTGLGDEALNFTPYIFYDLGKVWNDDQSQRDISGTSAGFGTRFATDFHFSANLGIAWPLTLPQSTPIYGYENHHNPRLLLQVSQEF